MLDRNKDSAGVGSILERRLQRYANVETALVQRPAVRSHSYIFQRWNVLVIFCQVTTSHKSPLTSTWLTPGSTRASTACWSASWPLTATDDQLADQLLDQCPPSRPHNFCMQERITPVAPLKPRTAPYIGANRGACAAQKPHVGSVIKLQSANWLARHCLGWSWVWQQPTSATPHNPLIKQPQLCRAKPKDINSYLSRKQLLSFDSVEQYYSLIGNASIGIQIGYWCQSAWHALLTIISLPLYL